jgi:hypothetical protein
MNVDSKWHANAKYNNPHSKMFVIPVSYWLVFTFLVPIGRHLHFSFWIRIAENTQTSRFTIHIIKVLRQSPLRIHYVVGKYAVYYPHHEDAWFIGKRLHEEINRALLTSWMWNVKMRMCIHDGSGILNRFCTKRWRTSKAHKIIETVKKFLNS